ncbi:hypothetical protein N752_12545 [Desulforamulus aquiferis]|nr:hypothetical protein [Desulforamulus aquiferis]RYD04748.1 hypothetical protein N752_12545 [Desulforamulus aquiferis]
MKKIQLGFNNPEQRHSKQWKQRFAKLRMGNGFRGHGCPRKPEVFRQSEGETIQLPPSYFFLGEAHMRDKLVLRTKKHSL